jgi:hypothetical protein
METMIVARFFRTADLILQTENDGGRVGNGKWFHSSMKPQLPRYAQLLMSLCLATDRPAWSLLNLRSAIIAAQGALVVKSRQGYKGYVIEARSCELKDGGFSAEFSVEEHDASGVTETQFYLPNTFPTQESAIEAATQAGRQKIDVGFERGSEVVKG